MRASSGYSSQSEGKSDSRGCGAGSERDMQEQGKRQVMAFLMAAQGMVDPHRGVLAEATPYILTGGRPLDALQPMKIIAQQFGAR